MAQLDIQPRQTLPPADIVMDTVPLQAIRTPSNRNCAVTQSLPFRADRMPDVAYSCEVTDSFFERIIDRFKGQGL
jgi:hypothetical protein